MERSVTLNHKRVIASSCLGMLFSFAPLELAHAVDLTVTNVEVTQSTQTTTNTIQLVTQRGTAVRATIGVAGSANSVAGVTGRLHVFRNGLEITPVAGLLPINAPMTAPLAPSRANENDTLNFELPGPTGILASNDVDFRVDITPVVGESNTGNNSGTANNLSFADRVTPLLYFTRINYTPSGLGLPADALILPGTGDAMVRGLLPVNDADPMLYQQGLFASLTFTEDANNDGRLDALGSDGNDLLSLLASCRQLIVNNNVGASDRIFLYGWLAGNPIDGNGLAQVGGRNAFGNTDPIRHQRSYGHELTHNFGFNHINSNIDQVGWDVGARLPNNPVTNNVVGRVKPTTLFDIQVAGLLTPQAWIETAKYNTLLSSPTLNDSPDQLVLSSRLLVIQGIFDPSGGRLVQLKPVFRYPWLSQPTAPLQRPGLAASVATQEQFAVEITEVTGRVTTIPINPRVADDPSKGEEEMPGFFEVMTPIPGEVATLKVRNITGATVGGFERSLPPTIQIISPVRDEFIPNRTVVSWKLKDPDTALDKLMVQAAFSPDSGRTFVPVAVDVSGEKTAFDATRVPCSKGSGLLRVFVSDGLNTASADVPGLSTPNNCLRPLDGTAQGLVGVKTICTNLTTRKSVVANQASNFRWDCATPAFVFSAGDNINVVVKGRAKSNILSTAGLPLNGDVNGIQNSKIVCTNLNSRQSVSAQSEQGGKWDCVRAGLKFKEGDTINVINKGFVN